MSEPGCIVDIVSTDISVNFFQANKINSLQSSVDASSYEYNNQFEESTFPNITSTNKVFSTETTCSYIKKNIAIEDYNKIRSKLPLHTINDTITYWDITNTVPAIDLNTTMFLFHVTINISSRNFHITAPSDQWMPYKILRILKFKDFITKRDSNNNPLAIVKCGITERYSGNNSSTFSPVPTVIATGMFVGDDYLFTLYNPSSHDLVEEKLGLYIDITNYISS